MIRLVRFKYRKATRDLVTDLAREKKLEPSFALDLYALLYHKGNGMPSPDRLAKLIKVFSKKAKVSEISVKTVANKKMAQLKSICGNAVFASCALRRKDLIGALRSLIDSLKEAEKKERHSQCITCPHFKKCDFGKQYGSAVYDVTRVIDPDYSKKAHPDCPHLPEIDATNRMADAADSLTKFFGSGNKPEQEVVKEHTPNCDKDGMNDLAKTQEAIEASGEGCADDSQDDLDADLPERDLEDVPEFMAHRTEPKIRSSKFDTSFDGMNVRNPEDTIKSLSTAQLALFELGRKFSLMLDHQKKGKWTPTVVVDENERNTKMTKLSDITKLNASAHGLPEEIFEGKLQRKELEKKEPLKPEEKKKCLYLLVDSSMSMKGWLKGGKILTRASLSATICLALSRRVEADKGVMYLRFFASHVSRRFPGRTAPEFEQLRNAIAMCSFDGSGTDILGGLRAAVEDIQQAAKSDNITQSEILCATDCEAMLNESTLRAACGGIEFNVLDVSGNEFSVNDAAAAALKKVANKYYKANQQTVDLQKIVDLV